MAEKNLPALTPAVMLEKAITSGANVEVMEKLMALQERWEAGQARKAFDTALADLREDLPAIVKTKAANFGPGRPAYKYEDLSEIIDGLAPALSKHGMSFRWRTESTAADSVTVTCILSHRDGHSETTSLTAKHDISGGKNAIQAIGSVVTYLQRYTLKAALGVAASVDDDAQSATQPQQNGEPPTRPAEAANAQRVSEPQRKRLWAICKSKGVSEQRLKDRLALYGFASGYEVTRDKYEEICKWAGSGGAAPDPIANGAPDYDQREPGSDDDDIPNFPVPHA